MKNLNTHTILLSFILLVSLMNGCQQCNNRNMINNNNNKITNLSKSIEVLSEVNRVEHKLNKENHKATILSVEKNAEMVIILESEIDSKPKNSSEIKQLINDHRK